MIEESGDYAGIHCMRWEGTVGNGESFSTAVD